MPEKTQREPTRAVSTDPLMSELMIQLAQLVKQFGGEDGSVTLPANWYEDYVEDGRLLERDRQPDGTVLLRLTDAGKDDNRWVLNGPVDWIEARTGRAVKVYGEGTYQDRVEIIVELTTGNWSSPREVPAADFGQCYVRPGGVPLL